MGDGDDLQASAAVQQRVLALLKRHGWNATSFQILEPNFRYWFADEDACVAYFDTGAAWVVAGAPIAAPERFAEVAGRFAAEAAQHRRRVCYFATERRFTERVPLASLPIGEQPVWDPAAWDTSLQQSRSLREQLRRARKKGVVVRAVAPEELADPGSAVRLALDALVGRWQQTRPMAPMGFLVQLHLYGHPHERRCFVAQVAGALVGALGVVPVYARGGWFLEDLLRDPAAPNGTAELLVDHAMRAAAAEGLGFVTLGLAPLSGVQHGWLRAARQWSAGLYDFNGLRAFKAKLLPQSWDPLYVSFPAGGVSSAGGAGGAALGAARAIYHRGASRFAIYDVLVAFSKEGLLRFGVRTLLRGPAVVVRLLALLLVPWTLLLAVSAGPRWFPSPLVRWGWVAFDGLLLGGLLWLSARWRWWLGTLLAVLVTADAVVTLGQVVLFNLARARGPADLLVLAVAVLAPTVAAVLLWAGRVHRHSSL